uniref:NADH-ubiquinone oxidoreductase chain 3 n=1 Tax=Ramulus mikado TaxID=2823491 RepID=E2RUV0_9NEOP|nr:NADH dehydrogenase subunit 3 [Ramulus irregulariterdentatus]BAJ24484.1 NADH dehydrogenase subunit 3 [Ramulus irregulariterdentatus]
MISVLIMAIATLIITNLVMIINMILYKSSITDREKNSPFECGFDPKSSPRMPFSLKFFLIAVIFLIFDIEIALMLPMMPTMMMSDMMQWMMTTTIFIMILVGGLYHEWNQGALNWVY